MVKPQHFAIIGKLDKLFLWRRIVFYKTSHNSGLYQGQLPILEYIIHNEGCTQKEIADKQRVSAASIASSTKRLQKAGMIQKKTDESNLRRNMLYVTEKGIATAENCRKEFDRFHESFFRSFSDEELELFTSFLDRFIRNVIEDESSVDLESLIALEKRAEKVREVEN
jgi:DNA-binding MarR family transcriptional regulator